MKIQDVHIHSVRSIIWNMEESIENILQQLPEPEKLQTQLQQIKSEQRKKEFIFVRYLIFLLSGKQEDIIYDTAGKPSIENNTTYISISHSKNFVCVATHPTLPIGVDIEVLGSKIERVKARFLNAQELQNVQTDPTQLKGHLYWSAKEAVYKIAGAEAVDFQKSIAIKAFNEKDDFFYAQVLPSQQQFKILYSVYHDFVFTLALPA